MDSEKELLAGDGETVQGISGVAKNARPLPLAVAIVVALALGAIVAMSRVNKPSLLYVGDGFDQKEEKVGKVKNMTTKENMLNGDECVPESGECSDGKMCCNARTCTRRPRPCIGCTDKFIYKCIGDIPAPPPLPPSGTGWGHDHILADEALLKGTKIYATPGGLGPDAGREAGGYFCAEVSDDGAFRMKSCRGHGDGDILTYLDSWESDQKKGGAFISLKYGYLGLYTEQWDEIWSLGKNEAKASGKKAIKLQMRRDGNLMMLTEDIDANNLDFVDSSQNSQSCKETCWEGKKSEHTGDTDATRCVNYEEHGYMCVGDNCAICTSHAWPCRYRCSHRAPPGSSPDPVTGLCTAPTYDSKIVWSLFQYQERQRPDCSGDARGKVPCRDERDCDYLCYPNGATDKSGVPLCSGCKNWYCFWAFDTDAGDVCGPDQEKAC